MQYIWRERRIVEYNSPIMAVSPLQRADGRPPLHGGGIRRHEASGPIVGFSPSQGDNLGLVVDKGARGHRRGLASMLKMKREATDQMAGTLTLHWLSHDRISRARTARFKRGVFRNELLKGPLQYCSSMRARTSVLTGRSN